MVVVATQSTAQAHLLDLTRLEIAITDHSLVATLAVPGTILSSYLPPNINPDSIDRATGYLREHSAAMILIQLDGRALHLESASSEAISDVVETRLVFALPPGTQRSVLSVESKFMERAGGEQLVTVIRPDGAIVTESVLTGERPRLKVRLKSASTDAADQAGPAPSPVENAPTASAPEAATPPVPRPSFFVLGIEHILNGYDHLLFLFGLLLVCDRFVTAAKIISLFTVAHTITLALAALSVFHLSGRIVEPGIAASITYVGIENLIRAERAKWRGLITFCFGLIHGLGFATALQELGLGSNGESVIAPLFGFNLGVETGQLAVASLVLPLLLVARKQPTLRPWIVPLGSTAVAVAGAFCLVERLWG
jgi:hydrogenase/urease accessory protein HupE